MKQKTIKSLKQIQENLKELEMCKESILQLKSELEDTYDIEDINERIDEEARLEGEIAEKKRSVNFLETDTIHYLSIEVIKDLMNCKEVKKVSL